ncbi:HNH endonuclease [Kitasatospora sp. NPDC001664]
MAPRVLCDRRRLLSSPRSRRSGPPDAPRLIAMQAPPRACAHVCGTPGTCSPRANVSRTSLPGRDTRGALLLPGHSGEHSSRGRPGDYSDRCRPRQRVIRVSSSRRSTPLPRDWPRRRRAAMSRASWMCEWVRYDTGEPCMAPARHCDHIVPASQGGSDEADNLRALCDWHVRAKDMKDAAAKTKGRQRGWQRARRPHPGEIREN